jgi:3-methylcrotonyl-CoA carboxylase alpha subunit
MAALRERGVVSVAVYSEADRDALHARLADEAIAIGPAAAAESYLSVERLVDAARRAGADAVHPGYGFLSESPRFAKAVEDAGLTFLGPRPETIDLLGDKRRARAVAQRVGAPVVPGWDGDAADRAGARAAAGRMGFPVLVKAAAGGGGKGMTRVDRPEDLDAALETAARVARSAFGDASVYVEKLIDRPRHVEVQILGDGEGNVVHFFERECSLQRRHQKIFEESPSPALDGPTRERLTAAAVAIAREVRYRSTGTCEFLLDPSGAFHFLEVNARIQVEHPVTELVTGRDLVQAQLDVAMTGTLPFSQSAIHCRGAAVEARVYAEDADAGFLPQSGRLLRVELPAGPWIRVDHGIAAGDVVTPHYDPLLAKILAQGADRAAAWHRLSRALEATVIHGPVTNLAFLRELAARSDVLAGDFHVASVEEKFMPERESRLTHGGEDLLAAAAALADRFDLAADAANGGAAVTAGPVMHGGAADPFDTLAGWRHPGLGGA